MADPIHSNNEQQPEMDPALLAVDVSNMIRNVELLALCEELRKQNITPGELTSILQECRSHNIHVRDFRRIARKIKPCAEGFDMVCIRVTTEGKALDIQLVHFSPPDPFPRRKNKHD